MKLLIYTDVAYYCTKLTENISNTILLKMILKIIRLLEVKILEILIIFIVILKSRIKIT